MAIRAKASTGYLARLAVVGAALLGFSLWSLYDGAIGYPAQIVRANKYLELKEAGNKEDWPEVALENGWSTDNPRLARC